MIKKILTFSTVSIATLLVTIGSAFALTPSNGYKISDRFATTSNGINIRAKACGAGDIVVGGVNKGVVGHYLGEKKTVTGNCRGLTGETWYKMVFSSPIPDGGTESVEGWVAGKFLDHVDALRKSISTSQPVRVNISDGYLNLRKNSLSGDVIAKLGKNFQLRVLSVSTPVKLNGVTVTPAKLEVNINGTKLQGFVNSQYIVSFSPWDNIQ